MAEETRRESDDAKEDEKIIDWLRSHAIGLTSTDPQENQKDLDLIKNIVGSAQVVGLGEATHGNKEFFQIKHRLIKFLIEEMGFNTVVFESPEESAKKINHYIQTGEGVHTDLLDGLAYEVWRTQEVLDLINWLREFNKKSDRKINFIGCDVDDQTGMSGVERDRRMAENVTNILGSSPDSKIALWAHNAHVGYADSPNFKSLGKYLKEALPDKYLNFGMMFNQGGLNARVGDFDTGVFDPYVSEITMQSAPEGTYEHFFAQIDMPLAIVDLSETKTNNLFASWRAGNYAIREVGWAYDPKHPDYHLNKADLANSFDSMVWVENVTPSTSAV